MTQQHQGNLCPGVRVLIFSYFTCAGLELLGNVVIFCKTVPFYIFLVMCQGPKFSTTSPSPEYCIDCIFLNFGNSDSCTSLAYLICISS